MEKVITICDEYCLDIKTMEKINKYLEEGWSVKSITVVTPHETSMFSVIFVLEK